VTAAAPARADALPCAFFTPREWLTASALAEMVIPACARSPGACDAGVPAFLDGLMTAAEESARTRMRLGLAWLDAVARRRTGRPFADAERDARAALLDEIAWLGRAPAAMLQGARFFDWFRDLVALGFWTSPAGLADLGYPAGDA
jgi:gluconate 2-dehydrogenase gamma chain